MKRYLILIYLLSYVLSVVANNSATKEILNAGLK